MEGNFNCADCCVKACRSNSEEKYPAFCPTKNLDPALLEAAMREYEDEETGKLMVVSACVEKDFYCKLTRVEETIQFIERMGYHKIGVATCIGLLDEARTFTKILRDKSGLVQTAVVFIFLKMKKLLSTILRITDLPVM